MCRCAVTPGRDRSGHGAAASPGAAACSSHRCSQSGVVVPRMAPTGFCPRAGWSRLQKGTWRRRRGDSGNPRGLWHHGYPGHAPAAAEPRGVNHPDKKAASGNQEKKKIKGNHSKRYGTRQRQVFPAENSQGAAGGCGAAALPGARAQLRAVGSTGGPGGAASQGVVTRREPGTRIICSMWL